MSTLVVVPGFTVLSSAVDVPGFTVESYALDGVESTSPFLVFCIQPVSSLHTCVHFAGSRSPICDGVAVSSRSP